MRKKRSAVFEGVGEVARRENGLLPADNNGEKKKRKNTSGKMAVKEKETPTVSIAVAASIIDNAQSLELATRLAGQIARAATIFRIDEVVVFDNNSISVGRQNSTVAERSDELDSGASFLLRILQYLETPQYLRKSLFPMHSSLKFVGILPPLDAPHHLRKHEWAPYREGVTLREKAPSLVHTLVDVGLPKNVVVEQTLDSGKRVTVAMGVNRNIDSGLVRNVVSVNKVREGGRYWGYKVRYAPNMSSVFSNCPHKGGYDCSVGTSVHGEIVKSAELVLPTFRHLLIVFGGLAGLEECIEEDQNLKGKGVGEVFDLYLNTCPHQGSRTIRTEEAIFISLQYFQEPISRTSERFYH